MFFKKKPEAKKGSLEEAKEKDLITQEEFLRLKVNRADEKLKEFLKPKGKK